MQNERIKELFLGLTLIVFLILLSVLVISISDGSSQNQSNIISNSYNVNSYNTNSQPSPFYENRIYVEKENVGYVKLSRTYERSKYLDYSDHAYQTRTKSVLGTDVNKYNVYVKNHNYKSGYFTVRYHFKDGYGDVETEKITHHIGPRESKQFLLKDISPRGYEKVSWGYEIISHSKKPAKKYYNNDHNVPDFRGNGFYSSPTKTYFYLN
jgi:hypothetical protein